MLSFDGRAEKEVKWREKHIRAIKTVAMFAGTEPLVVGSNLSKRICKGRIQVFEFAELIGYR